jgi:hypothetical protein
MRVRGIALMARGILKIEGNKENEGVRYALNVFEVYI